MFWSKIWFFLVAVAAATALTIALVLPRPAAREAERDEIRHLADACVVANILLTDNARDRIGFTGDFARAEGIDKALATANAAGEINGDMNKAGRDAAAKLLGDIKGTPPSFVYLVDTRGRVVAREGTQADRTRFGDSLANYPLVQDALAGYLRDDVWLHNRALFLVSASPVINRSATGDAYVGAVVLGYMVDKGFADDFAKNLKFSIAFYAADQSMASSSTVSLHKDVIDEYGKLRAGLAKDRSEDCATNKPFTVSTDSGNFAALIARLPGEASGDGGGFYAVFAPRPKSIGFMGTFGALKKEDLGFGNFPWIPLGIAFLVIIGVGMALMIFETDRPLRKLVDDAVVLAKGERPRLQEEAHRGKFGSIARSVNIQLDKQEREAKAAKKDLDNLLGPADQALAAAGSPVSPLPARGPGLAPAEPFRPPPPSEFRFGGGPPSVAPPPGPPAAPATLRSSDPFDLDLPPPPGKEAQLVSATHQRVAPPPITLPGSQKVGPPPRPPAPPPPPPLPPRAPSPPARLDDDILGDDELEALPTVPADVGHMRRPGDFDAPTVVADPSQELLAAASGDDDKVFRKVFEEFIAMKKKCGEPTASLTFDKFKTKLEKNRSELIAKHGCKQVRFQVYIKDGKAALKATPVKS